MLSLPSTIWMVNYANTFLVDAQRNNNNKNTKTTSKGLMLKRKWNGFWKIIAGDNLSMQFYAEKKAGTFCVVVKEKRIENSKHSLRRLCHGIIAFLWSMRKCHENWLTVITEHISWPSLILKHEQAHLVDCILCINGFFLLIWHAYLLRFHLHSAIWFCNHSPQKWYRKHGLNISFFFNLLKLHSTWFVSFCFVFNNQKE